MAGKNIDIKVRTTTSGYKDIQGISRSFANMNREVASLKTGTKGLTNALKLGKTGLAQLATTALGLVGKMGTLNNILMDAETSAFNLAASVGAAQKEFKNTGSLDYWEKTIKELSKETKIYSELSLKKAVSHTIDLTKRMGFSADQMKILIKRTADISAGKVDLNDGIKMVTGALRGEGKAIAGLGVQLGEKYVEAQYKADKSHVRTWKSLNQVEKAQYRFSLLLKQTGAEQGRASKYAKTYAGAMEQVETAIKNAITNNENITESLNRLAVLIRDNADEIGEVISSLIDGLAKIIDTVLNLKKSYDEMSPSMKSLIKTIAGSALGFSLLGNKALFAKNKLEVLFNTNKRGLPSFGKLNNAMKLGGAATGLARITGFVGLTAWSANKVMGAVQAYRQMRDAQEEAKKATDRVYTSSEKLQKKYEDFKNIEIPGNFLNKPLDELKEFESQLRKARVYYVATMTKLQQQSQETDIWGNMTEGATKAFEELQKVEPRYREIVEAQQEAAKKIKILEKEKTVVIKTQGEKREEALKRAAKSEQRISEQMFQTRKREEETYSDFRSIEQKKQLTSIDTALAKELISHAKANLKKAELEKAWAVKRLNYIKENLEYAENAYKSQLGIYEENLRKAEKAYGKDSKEYLEHLKIKTEAEKNYLDTLKSFKQAELNLMIADNKVIEAKKKLKTATDEGNKSTKKSTAETKENTKGAEKNTKETKKNTKSRSQASSVLRYYIELMEKLTKKYADQKQTQSELNESLKKMIDMEFGAFSVLPANHPFIGICGVVIDKIHELLDAYEDVEEAAWTFGFSIDTTNLSLSEAKKLIMELVETFADFENETADISKTIYSVTSGLDDLGKSATSSEISLAQLYRGIGSLRNSANNLYKTEWVNAEDMQEAARKVIEAYAKIRDQGIARIEELKGGWQSLSDKITSITEQILNIESDTEDKIRELRRKNMTSEEAWQDRRLEYNEKINAAIRAMDEGNYKSAASLYKEAQAIAESLAEEIQDQSGEVIKSLEENTALSIDLINQASDGMHSSLTAQKNSFSSQQRYIRGEINKTANALTGLSASMNNINQKSGNLFTAKAWDNTYWGDYWYRTGLYKYSTGGYVTGPSHANGGVKAELEGNEFVQPGKAVNHYGLGFMELIRQLRFPKPTEIKNLFSPKIKLPKFGQGGFTKPHINIPPLPKFAAGSFAGGLKETQGPLYTVNVTLNGRNTGPLHGTKNSVESFINELKRAQELT